MGLVDCPVRLQWPREDRLEPMALLKVFYRCRKCEAEFDSGRETPDAASWLRTSKSVQYVVCTNCTAINRYEKGEAIFKPASA
jgi:DNA-directed RNA polymerase subunit RPC12/RpoP